MPEGSDMPTKARCGRAEECGSGGKNRGNVSTTNGELGSLSRSVRCGRQRIFGRRNRHAQVIWRVAEDCEAVEGAFVREPWTLVLMGSGWANRAGYATLRWRVTE